MEGTKMTPGIMSGDVMNRLENACRGRSFTCVRASKGSVSGRSVLAVVTLITKLAQSGIHDVTAEQLAVVYSVRVVRRVLQLLKSADVIQCDSFRKDDSPRVHRVINWENLNRFADFFAMWPKSANVRFKVSANS